MKAELFCKPHWNGYQYEATYKYRGHLYEVSYADPFMTVKQQHKYEQHLIDQYIEQCKNQHSTEVEPASIGFEEFFKYLEED